MSGWSAADRLVSMRHGAILTMLVNVRPFQNMFWHAMLFAPCSFVMIWVVGGVWVSSVEQGVGAHVLARGRR